MCTIRVVVRTGMGLHARPAALLVREANRHASTICLEYGDRRADGKSLLQVLALGVRDGEELTLRAEGGDEREAIASLADLISGGFKETHM